MNATRTFAKVEALSPWQIQICADEPAPASGWRKVVLRMVGAPRNIGISDRKVRTALLMYFGEAGTKIMDDHPAFVEAHPEILWRGMRNRIAHGYFDINLDLVWETVQRSPKLKARPDLKRLATPRVGAWRSPSISRAQTR